MSDPTLSVIVASSGRPTLPAAIASIVPQLLPGDELLVDVNDDAPWGHAARNRMMPRARGDALMFLDDDDQYTNDALTIARRLFGVAPNAMHLFRMRYPDGRILWREQWLEMGNVSTQMVVVPNLHLTIPWSSVPQWGDRYEGDWDFISEVARTLGEPVVWHQLVIALVRPHESRAQARAADSR